MDGVEVVDKQRCMLQLGSIGNSKKFYPEVSEVQFGHNSLHTRVAIIRKLSR